MILPFLTEKVPFFNNPTVLITIFILITLPGLLLLLKAFWDYLVAYGAINSMAENMTKSGKLYDFNAHTLLINCRKFSFAFLWILFSLFIFTTINPIFWIAGSLVFVFFSLVFQVFTLEPEKNVFQCFKKSFELTKSKYFQTLLLLVLVGSLTYILIPEIIRILCGLTGIVTLFANLIQNIVALNLESFSTQMNTFNSMLQAANLPPLSVLDVSKIIVLSTIGWMVIAFLLPIRSLACYLLYKKLNKAYLTKLKKNTKKDVQM